MNKTISYKESTAIAIQAMISAARKDEYADRKKKKVVFPKTERNVMSTLKDVREMEQKKKIIKRMQELPSMQ